MKTKRGVLRKQLRYGRLQRYSRQTKRIRMQRRINHDCSLYKWRGTMTMLSNTKDKANTKCKTNHNIKIKEIHTNTEKVTNTKCKVSSIINKTNYTVKLKQMKRISM